MSPPAAPTPRQPDGRGPPLHGRRGPLPSASPARRLRQPPERRRNLMAVHLFRASAYESVRAYPFVLGRCTCILPQESTICCAHHVLDQMAHQIGKLYNSHTEQGHARLGYLRVR
ncbi:hypothetical protein PVAP13_3NG071469 [Panicum virgatum]|uniref:Uncharacterized protein n=1 Tax=Panicum virgatum TaxID=38727 RepID=A0A8T0U2Q5_PANVG|nr:hypothetical protein PVAP13_3NG071469 [Panicum virgatum]